MCKISGKNILHSTCLYRKLDRLHPCRMDIYFLSHFFPFCLNAYFLFVPFLLLYYLCVMESSFHRSMWLQTCAMQNLAGATISTERHYQVRSAKQRPGCCENLSLAKFSTHDMLFFVVFLNWLFQWLHFNCGRIHNHQWRQPSSCWSGTTVGNVHIIS